MSENGGKLIRGKLWFDGGFTMVPNTWARDKIISHQARGLLVQLASHDVGYEVTIEALMGVSIHGREAIRNQVGELERSGYLKRYRPRVKGRLQPIEWKLMDPHAPVDASGTPLEGLEPLEPLGTQKTRSEPATGMPSPVEPSPVEPSPVNPTTIEDQLKEHLYPALEVTTGADASTAPCGHRWMDGCAGRYCEFGHAAERVGASS